MRSENGDVAENVRAAALAHDGGYSMKCPCYDERQFWGKPFRYERSRWCLKELEPQFAS